MEWAVRHGHTTFVISYRNPDDSMGETTFDDYLRLGPLTAVEVARSISGSDVVNTIGICLGGTLNAMMLAYLHARGERRVNASTLLNSAIDYADSGVLADVFSDAPTIDAMCRRMAGSGYLESKEMSRTFTMIRADELLFRYVVNNWLLGESPPAFDLLAWNEDDMHIPGKAHACFLRNMCVENRLANNELSALDTPLRVTDIETDTYIVAAIDDHIVPWQSSYKSTQLLSGPVRFVLTSSGHIAGIVNPPGRKAKLWLNDDLAADPQHWLANATPREDSWWNDWVNWLGERAGARTAPPSMGIDAYPPIGDAPGLYVRS